MWNVKHYISGSIKYDTSPIFQIKTPRTQELIFCPKLHSYKEAEPGFKPGSIWVQTQTLALNIMQNNRLSVAAKIEHWVRSLLCHLAPGNWILEDVEKGWEHFPGGSLFKTISSVGSSLSSVPSVYPLPYSGWYPAPCFMLIPTLVLWLVVYPQLSWNVLHHSKPTTITARLREVSVG